MLGCLFVLIVLVFISLVVVVAVVVVVVVAVVVLLACHAKKEPLHWAFRFCRVSGSEKTLLENMPRLGTPNLSSSSSEDCDANLLEISTYNDLKHPKNRLNTTDFVETFVSVLKEFVWHNS